jgi:hypothetical protein
MSQEKNVTTLFSTPQSLAFLNSSSFIAKAELQAKVKNKRMDKKIFLFVRMVEFIVIKNILTHFFSKTIVSHG